MKKVNTLYKTIFIVIAILSLFVTSCANLFDNQLKEKATLYFSLNDTDARAVAPSYDFETFTDFSLIGKKGSEAEKKLGEWANYNSLNTASVKIGAGSWSFTLNAKKGSEDFSATTTAIVKDGDQITLKFVLTHASSTAKGGVNISIKYSLNTSITKVEYKLTKLDATKSEIDAKIEGDEINSKVINIQKEGLAAGKYLLECNFYSDAEDVGSYYEIILVESGMTTEFDYEIPYLKGSVKNGKVASTRKGNLDYIFNTSSLGTTTITIKRSEWNKLCNDYRYFFKNENCVHAESYSYEKDGELWKLNNVGFRLRGNTSRFCPQGYDNGNIQDQANASWSSDYYNYANQPNNDYRQTHFKVDFEEFCEDGQEQKMAGCLKGMALKRMDNLCAKEIFCYDLFRKNGIWTAPRASHTRVILKIKEDESDNTVTTVDYGVYEMFEEVNKQSLKARDKDENTAENAWKNSKGNLWKCSNDLTDSQTKGIGIEDIRIIYKGESVPAGMKTNGREDSERIGHVWNNYNMDLKTNKSDFAAAETELRAFIAELNTLPTASSDTDIASINSIKAFYEKWFDVDFFLKTYAINIACGMDDDYWGNANNYYLYFDTDSKGSGKVYFIPFDYDNTLGASINGDKEGFKHNPLEWGRGKKRPLMDKLLSVPQYREKFKDYLLEVTDNEYWETERCQSLFRTWGAMCNSYMNSPDLNFHIGVSEFRDMTSWNPEGFSIFGEPNVFDATYYYLRKNLGVDVSDHKYAIYDPEPLPESDAPAENPQTSTGDSSIPDGEKVTVSNSSGDTETHFTISVTPKYNGLYIEKTHHSIWEHVTIHIMDVTDNLENVRIVTDHLHNEFLYPFVQKGHEYKVWITAQHGNWTGWADSSRSELKTTALGGLGNYRVTYSDYRYDGPSYSLVFDDLSYTRPQLEGISTRVDASICSEGVWGPNQIYPGNIKFTNSTADLSPAAIFIGNHKRIHIVLTLKFKHNNIDYEYTIFENNNNTLINDDSLYTYVEDFDCEIKDNILTISNIVTTSEWDSLVNQYANNFEGITFIDFYRASDNANLGWSVFTGEIDLNKVFAGYRGVSKSDQFVFNLSFEFRNKENNKSETIVVIPAGATRAKNLHLTDDIVEYIELVTDSSKPGLNLKFNASKIPANADSRRIMISNSDGLYASYSDNTAGNTCYFPYVNPNSLYNVHVIYYWQGDEYSYKEFPYYNFTITSGLGEISKEDFTYKIENNHLIISKNSTDVFSNGGYTIQIGKVIGTGDNCFSCYACKVCSFEEGEVDIDLSECLNTSLSTSELLGFTMEYNVSSENSNGNWTYEIFPLNKPATFHLTSDITETSSNNEP